MVIFIENICTKRSIRLKKVLNVFEIRNLSVSEVYKKYAQHGEGVFQWKFTVVIVSSPKI